MIIGRLTVLLLCILSFFGLIAPLSYVDAQTNSQNVYLCFNQKSATGDLYKPAIQNNQRVCPANTHQEIGPFENSSNKRFGGLCIGPVPGQRGVYGYGEATLDDPGASTPKYSCPLPQEKLFLYSSIATYKPPTSTNTNTNSSNNTQSNNTVRNNTTRNNTVRTNNSTTNQSQGGCEEGFHESGPLCVPNNPFTNQDSVLTANSLGELATKIIKILLFFAGIIAVVMVIIGGYQVMTASSNDAQAKNGRKTLTNALIGLAIVILSYMIVQAVVNYIIK